MPKVSGYTAVTTLASGDEFYVVASGSSAKIDYDDMVTLFSGSGSAITLDLGDDGGNDSTALSEIATSGDTNSIFTEPSADKLLIDVSQAWPTADEATSALGLRGVSLDATVGTPSDGNILVYRSAGSDWVLEAKPGAGGSAITLDLGDDGGNDSTDLTEIATSGDTNNIFTEPSADKLLIDVSQNWPTADLATTATTANNLAAGALDAITEIDATLRSGSDLTLITGTAGTNGNVAMFNADGDVVDGSVVAADILVDGDIGTSVQAQGAVLDDLNTLGASTADGEFLVATGAGTLAWESGATARASLGLVIGTDVQAYDADTLKADTADVLTAGFAATPYNAGTQSSGTYTPDEANGNLQYAVNGGAHTLAPPTNNGTIIVQYTNNASAGSITTTGFTLVDGDSFDTTDGNDFLCFIVKHNNFSSLTVKALQ